MKEIIEYIDNLQTEADTGVTDINVLFWVGTNTIKERLKEKEEYINQNSNEIHEYGVKERLDRNDKDRNINAT